MASLPDDFEAHKETRFRIAAGDVRFRSMIQPTSSRAAAAFIGSSLLWCGCGVGVPDHDIVRSTRGGTITHFGVTLDQAADPVDVAFVALRAMRDDFRAANKDDRRAALVVQLETAALDLLERLKRAETSREEVLYGIVRQWTPAVSHYVSDFPLTHEAAVGRLAASPVRRESKDQSFEVCDVFLQVADPDGLENADTVIQLRLARDNGFWRVLTVGFEPDTRSLTARAH